MAGEIAYKLTAEEKQAVDAIRKVAEAFQGFEGGIKKVTEETKKAEQAQRDLDRMKLRNPRKIFARKCDKCQTEMQTTYAPERPEKVYCQTCFNKATYG